MSCTGITKVEKVLMCTTFILLVILHVLLIVKPSKTECASAPVETKEITIEEPIESEPTPTQAVEVFTSLGEFKLTAYCACEKCCGKWALSRPTDANGNPIVYTADGSVARQGVTVAADGEYFPFGTKLYINECEYIVQDRGGAIKGNRIDMYFESHDEALQFGVQNKEVFIKEVVLID